MHRLPTLLLGPEVVLGIASALVLLFCARHGSGEGRDVELLERLAWLLPLVIVPPAFATIFVPGAKSWPWLVRTVGFTFIALGVCAARIIGGFGEGAKGQDAAFLVVMIVGLVVVSLGTAISGAMILAATRPGFADWFGARPIAGSILTLLSALPLGAGLGLLLALGVGVAAGLGSALKR